MFECIHTCNPRWNQIDIQPLFEWGMDMGRESHIHYHLGVNGNLGSDKLVLVSRKNFEQI